MNGTKSCVPQNCRCRDHTAPHNLLAIALMVLRANFFVLPNGNFNLTLGIIQLVLDWNCILAVTKSELGEFIFCSTLYSGRVFSQVLVTDL